MGQQILDVCLEDVPVGCDRAVFSLGLKYIPEEVTLLFS